MKQNSVLIEPHSHSTFSDGTFTPTELAAHLAKRRVRFWSLTDHDTCQGTEEAIAAAMTHRIRFVPGIEISAWDTRSIHVLGLGVDPIILDTFATSRIQIRHERMEEMVFRLRQAGVDVSMEDAQSAIGKGIPGRPHLAQALLKKGIVSSMQEAFDRFLAAGKVGYVETSWPRVEEAIELIRMAGGLSILAHPGKDDVTEAEVARWVEMGLEGIEVKHPSHTLRDEEHVQQWAERFGIFKMASTDYHGPGRSKHDAGVEISRNWLVPVLERLGIPLTDGEHFVDI